jgi:hypothetical protein
MNELILFFVGMIHGCILGYIVWAPKTSFKQAFLDGMTLQFLWRKRK